MIVSRDGKIKGQWEEGTLTSVSSLSKLFDS